MAAHENDYYFMHALYEGDVIYPHDFEFVQAEILQEREMYSSRPPKENPPILFCGFVGAVFWS